jgi:ribosomal protein S18 acetylase RimI-like enzyme
MTTGSRTHSYLKWLILVGTVIAGISLWRYTTGSSEGIYTYNPSTDRAFVIDMFKQDWYWLISDYSPDYSVEHMLDTKSASREPQDFGKLIIKTYRVKGKPVGFICYYKGELLEGRILFLSVDKTYRGKGYARTLLNFALDDLKKQGIRVARMFTRVDNERGRKLYTGLGFKQIWTDGAYLMYEKVLEP